MFPGAVVVWLYAAFLLALGGFMTLRGHGATNPYALMADAAMHGRLDVDPSLHDVAVTHGRGYYPFGPLPAIFLLPIVAMGGRDVPNFAIAVAALAAALPALYRLARAQVESRLATAWWVMAAVAGTPLLACTFSDNAYYAAHVVVVACLGWALWLAIDGRFPLVAGILVGMAAATRFDAALGLLPIALLQARATATGRRQGLPGALMVVAGAAPFLVVLGGYNAARFGTPFESGYGLQQLNYPWLARLRGQGLFSLRHVPENLYYLLVAGPVFADGARNLPTRFPWLVPSEWGMGILWTSPWLLGAVLARGRRVIIVAAGAAVILLPSLLYYGVGWIQFGYRYALDALPFLFVLAIWGAGRLPGGRRTLIVLFMWSIVVNIWGDLWLVGFWGLPRANVG